jgi:hypothetical protein
LRFAICEPKEIDISWGNEIIELKEEILVL